MEKLDLYSMYERFQVFPYSLAEIQSTIEFLDKEGLIDITIVANMKKRITQDRDFKIRHTLLEK